MIHSAEENGRKQSATDSERGLYIAAEAQHPSTDEKRRRENIISPADNALNKAAKVCNQPCVNIEKADDAEYAEEKAKNCSHNSGHRAFRRRGRR